MRIAGIIAEYNPFHNGHALHVERARELTGCDYVAACMSGHFTQRGEPAMFSKWDRARMALSCGVDAVFELPALFAVRTADAFARGGVAILDGLGVDALCFGSETDDMALIEKLASLRDDEPRALSEKIREKLEEGKSHARARGEAIGEMMGMPETLMNRPNLALAVEYLRAIAQRGSNMTPVAIRRVGDYHDPALGQIASATAIRAAFARGEADRALMAMPEAARRWAVPEAMHGMDDVLLYRLRGMDLQALAALPDVGEGLENRLHKCCREACGREALLEALKCKRYTHARLSRTLTHALIGMDRNLIRAVPAPRYARLIGMRRGAEGLLPALKARARLPIVSRAAELTGDPCFELECRATDVWALLHDAPRARPAGRECREKFVVVD